MGSSPLLRLSQFQLGQVKAAADLGFEKEAFLGAAARAAGGLARGGLAAVRGAGTGARAGGGLVRSMAPHAVYAGTGVIGDVYSESHAQQPQYLNAAAKGLISGVGATLGGLVGGLPGSMIGGMIADPIANWLLPGKQPRVFKPVQEGHRMVGQVPT